MSERKISNLCQLDGRIYLWFRDKETREQFCTDAEKEGYHYGDGVSLREREIQGCMALNEDLTVNFLGFAGRMAFGYADYVGAYWDHERKCMMPGNRKIIRVDYAKWKAGQEDFIIPRSK